MSDEKQKAPLVQVDPPVEARTVEQAPASGGTAIMALIERAARDESVDIDKMERLFEMHERMTARQAKEEFHQALAEMQIELPEITKRGETRDKDGNLMYNFAKWEDINREIKPILAKHGFGLSFRIQPDQAGLNITAVLSRNGHTEETSIVQSLDMGGAKMNPNQARGAATSYGKRYTSGALLNLISYEEQDTDAVTPLSGDTLTAEQVKTVRALLTKLDRPEEAFLTYMGKNGVTVATELESVPVESFEKMQETLAQWAKKLGAK
tara:strand:+ start:1072 stop:1872 length:801 start_codon:yes stop_codon:yes gene_type:complete